MNQQMIDTIITILISGALGYVVGNSLRYTQVVREQDQLKLRIQTAEQEIAAIKLGEQRMLDEIQKMKTEVVQSINDLKLQLKDKADKDD